MDGIDLNLSALKASISCKGKLFCYDIFEERPEFRETYDFLLLFDVLEHIEDQLGFLTRASDFVRPGGWIAINVPARQELFSAFDAQVGHVRRYSLESLSEVVATAGLNEKVTTYWGYPLVPLLWVRKIMLRGAQGGKVIQTGFSPRSRFDQPCAHFACGFGADSEQDLRNRLDDDRRETEAFEPAMSSRFPLLRDFRGRASLSPNSRP